MSESGGPRNPDEPSADRPTQHLPADAPADTHAVPEPTVEQPAVEQPAVDDTPAAGAAEPPPVAAHVHPAAAVPPADSRWRRRSRSHPLQLLAAGLVGLVLGGFLTAATGALLLNHHMRHSERMSFDRKVGPGGWGGRDGERRGERGDRWGGDRRDGRGGPGEMPRRMFPPGPGQLPDAPSAPPAPSSPPPSPTP